MEYENPDVLEVPVAQLSDPVEVDPDGLTEADRALMVEHYAKVVEPVYDSQTSYGSSLPMCAAYAPRLAPNAQVVGGMFVPVGQINHNVLAVSPVRPSKTATQPAMAILSRYRMLVRNAEIPFYAGASSRPLTNEWRYRRNFGMTIVPDPDGSVSTRHGDHSMSIKNFDWCQLGMELWDLIMDDRVPSAPLQAPPVYARFTARTLPTASELVDSTAGMPNDAIPWWGAVVQGASVARSPVQGVIAVVGVNGATRAINVAINGPRGLEVVTLSAFGESWLQPGQTVSEGEAVGLQISADPACSLPPWFLVTAVAQQCGFQAATEIILQAAASQDIRVGDDIFRPTYMCPSEAMRRHEGIYERLPEDVYLFQKFSLTDGDEIGEYGVKEYPDCRYQFIDAAVLSAARRMSSRG